MKKFKKICYLVLLIMIIIVLLPCIIILYDYIFKLENSVKWIEIIISLAGIIATLVLGWIANNQNNRLIKIEKERDIKEKQSTVFIDTQFSCTSAIRLSNDSKEKYVDSDKYVLFKISNCGEAPLKLIKLNFNQDVEFLSHICLPKDKSKIVKIMLPHYFDENRVIKVTFISSYDKETYGDFKLKKRNTLSPSYTIKYYHYNADKKGTKK